MERLAPLREQSPLSSVLFAALGPFEPVFFATSLRSPVSDPLRQLSHLTQCRQPPGMMIQPLPISKAKTDAWGLLTDHSLPEASLLAAQSQSPTASRR